MDYDMFEQIEQAKAARRQKAARKMHQKRTQYAIVATTTQCPSTI
jgi:hypothetical protein